MPPLESKFCNSSYILSIYYSETWIVIWICNYIKNLDILIQKSNFYRLFFGIVQSLCQYVSHYKFICCRGQIDPNSNQHEFKSEIKFEFD